MTWSLHEKDETAVPEAQKVVSEMGIMTIDQPWSLQFDNLQGNYLLVI